jgi:hypothetical protein
MSRSLSLSAASSMPAAQTYRQFMHPVLRRLSGVLRL